MISSQALKKFHLIYIHPARFGIASFCLLLQFHTRRSIMTKRFFILTALFLVSVQPLFSAELTILTENLPPLNYLKENVLVGPSVE